MVRGLPARLAFTGIAAALLPGGFAGSLQNYTTCDQLAEDTLKKFELLPGYDPAIYPSRSSWRSLLQRAKYLCGGKGDAANAASRRIFDDPRLTWTQSNFVTTQMHPYDLYFYDPATGEYTVDRYVADVKRRYGGLDSLLLWPLYPTLGIDSRNMFDLFDAMPGGGRGGKLKDAIRKLKDDYGIETLLPLTPWDRGTRWCDNCTQDDGDHATGIALLTLLNDTGAYGFNGDTMKYVSKDFYSDYSKTGVAIEPELMGIPAMRGWHTMGWGYWNWTPSAKTGIPGVDFWKFAYDGRWMTHGCERWSKNHTTFVQGAFLEGVGFTAWENVWGIWNGIVPRDGELIRRVAAIQRFFSSRGGANHDGFFNSPDDSYVFFEYNGCFPTREGCPFVEDGVYASYFPRKAVGDAVYTLTNRVDAAKTVDFHFGSPVQEAYDCYSGTRPTWTTETSVSVTVQANGIGCLYTVDASPADASKLVDAGALSSFMEGMAAMTAKPLDSFSSDWAFLPQTTESNAAPGAPQVARAHMRKTPVPAARFVETVEELDGVEDPAAWLNAGLLKIPGAERYEWFVKGVMIEGDEGQFGVDVQYPFEARPVRTHNHTFANPSLPTIQGGAIRDFYLDKYPVTVADYALYLKATKYDGTADRHNFLKNWDWSSGAPRPTSGILRQPVTYVGLAEAKAFCSWRGARLPHSFEWQYAAQGGDRSRVYPWGSEPYDFKSGVKCPKQVEGKDTPVPDDVTAHERTGVSPFGIVDLVGNVWQYTDSFWDEHTRGAVVRGSGKYFSGPPFSSLWYFPRAQELQKSNKMLLMDNAYERNAMTGFRCAADELVELDEEAELRTLFA